MLTQSPKSHAQIDGEELVFEPFSGVAIVVDGEEGDDGGEEDVEDDDEAILPTFGLPITIPWHIIILP